MTALSEPIDPAPRPHRRRRRSEHGAGWLRTIVLHSITAALSALGAGMIIGVLDFFAEEARSQYWQNFLAGLHHCM